MPQKITAVETTKDTDGNSVVTVRGARRKVLVRERFALAAHARSFHTFCRRELESQDKRA